MRLLVIGSILLMLNIISMAEELSFEQALQTAARLNPSLRAARWEVASAQGLMSAARRPAPLEVLLAPALATGGTEEELMMAQPLEINGMRTARARLAAAELSLSLAEAEIALNEVLAEVAAAYLEAMYRDRLAQIAREALHNAEQVAYLVRQQIEAGARPGIDLVQAEIEAERVRLQSRQREAEASSVRVRLNTLLGYPQDRQYTFTPLPASLFREQSAVESARVPEVAREQALLNVYQRRVEQTRLEGIPDVAVRLRVERWVGKRTRPGVALAINLPFLDYSARQERLMAQNRQVAAQQLRLQATQQKLVGEQERARLLLESARVRWRGFEQQILPRTEQLARSAQVGLETGALNILQVLEAQRTVRSAREEAVEAELQLALAWVENQRIHGYFARTYSSFWKEAQP
ncbi:MAG: TolC family protein [bacterium]|nr:TolC family protein [bacterium]